MKRTIHGGADRRDPEGGGGRDQGIRAVPEARHRRVDVLHLARKYGGMTVSDAQRLKRIVADLTLDNTALKDVLSKKW